MKIAIIIMILLLMNVFFIVSNKNIPLNSPENISQVSEIYFNWVKAITKNLGTISGNVVNLNWVPDTTTPN